MRLGQFARSEIWTVSYWGSGHAAMIRAADRVRTEVVPVFLTEGEPENSPPAIRSGGGVQSSQPAAYDLLLTVLSTCNAHLESVEMFEGKEGECRCRLIVNQNGRRRTIEARPADALPLMMKSGCELFVSKDIFSHRGIPLEQATILTEERLKKELTGAIVAENYELAARIRDQLEQIH